MTRTSRIVPALLLLSASPAAMAQASLPASDRARLEAELNELQQMRREFDARISRLEAELRGTSAAPPAGAPVPAADPSISTAAAKPAKAPSGDSLELYGFAQADFIQDFDRVDPQWEDAFRPSKIPTTEGTFGSDGQTSFSVKQTRLGVVGKGNVANRPYEAKFEFDLFGTGVDAGQTTFRLRHAYGSWGPILAGQTNTLFMDGDLFPNVLDYWGPTGMVFVRNPQLRFTFLNADGWSAAVALERPSDDIDPGEIRLINEDVATNLRANEELPDLTGQVRYAGDWGHVQLSGVLRKIGYDTVGTPDNEPQGDELGWGLNLGTSFNVALATFRLGVVYGEGIASYMNDGGTDLAPSAQLVPTPPIFPPPSDPPEALLLSATSIPLLGITAYVDLNWTDQLTSSLGYSLTEVDNTNFQAPEAFKRGEYASANLLWSPAKRFLTGAELLWGKRTDNDGASGEDVRLQMSVKVSFSSGDVW